MRIIIETDDKGQVNIDTGDKSNDKPRLFESTTDIPVTDAGPAPIQDIERQRKGMTAAEVSNVYASPSQEDREAQLPLNPLRAGAAAAYQDPANVRRMSVAPEERSATQDRSSSTIDAGAAPNRGHKESSDPNA